MEKLFVTRAGNLRERWREAFPTAGVTQALEGPLSNKMVWIDTSFLEPGEVDELIDTAVAGGAQVVVLSPTPSESEAIHFMARGARGYAHVLAQADTLREVVAVLDRGGVWLEPGLMMSLLKITDRLINLSTGGDGDLSMLTERELAVAQLIGSGASNREIATDLEITERTVKAHLTAIFEKLEVRDRVQLAIKVRQSLGGGSVN